jgi:hypothetical protein
MTRSAGEQALPPEVIALLERATQASGWERVAKASRVHKRSLRRAIYGRRCGPRNYRRLCTFAATWLAKHAGQRSRVVFDLTSPDQPAAPRGES